MLEGNGHVGEYIGGYSDWLRQRPAIAEATQMTSVPASSTPVAATPSAIAASKRKLSYKETRELEQLPARIEALEARLAEMTAAMNDPAFYQRSGAEITAHNAALAETQGELDTAYARWAELDA